AEELQFYEQYKPKGFVRAKSRFTDEIWRKVFHPDQDRYVSAIYGAIWQGAALVQAFPFKAYEKEFGLKRKEKRQVETDQLLFSKVFYYTSQVLRGAARRVPAAGAAGRDHARQHRREGHAGAGVRGARQPALGTAGEGDRLRLRQGALLHAAGALPEEDADHQDRPQDRLPLGDGAGAAELPGQAGAGQPGAAIRAGAALE